MKKLLLFCLILVMLLAHSAPVECREYKLALPGYKLKFPADHASHNDYKTEWWYYTGHLQSNEGTKYGYELTFFRFAMDVLNPVKKSAWGVNDVYLAHFAVSDLNEKRFFHTEKMNRAGVGFAGADSAKYRVWNQNWRASLTGEAQKIVADSPDYSIELTLTSKKPPVLHGIAGLSQKASCKGCASYYYSMTRLLARGFLTHKGRRIPVSGISWMDHEFGSNQLTKEQVGWDWFSLQLDDNTEVMLYVMRRRDGSLDPNSSGTYLAADGSTIHLSSNSYALKPKGTWKSPHSPGTYPMGWHVSIPSLKVELDVMPEMEDQELTKGRDSDVTYWEGTCRVQGSVNAQSATGQAYVEMTGYAEKFSERI